MTDPRPLIAGNWKMNGLASGLGEARAVALALTAEPSRARVVICPPATLIDRLADAVMGSPLEIGAQDLSVRRRRARSPATCRGRC